MKIKVADFVFEISNLYGEIEKMCESFFTDLKNVDKSITITDEMLMCEKQISEYKFRKLFLEVTLCYRKIAEWLPLHNSFVLHSACFDVDGTGVVFAAHSGTGKTTHMMLWQKLLGDRLTIVNGDKPIVRFFDDEPEIPYAYGTPWNGKERLGCNMRTPVKHICFIERATENSCEKMEPGEAIDLIFNQVYMPKDPMAIMNTMQLINRFISSCNIWKIKCNMDISAAETAYSAIFGGEHSQANAH